MTSAVRRRAALLLAALALLSGAHRSTAQRRTGSIRGRVVDAVSGQPLAGAQLSIPGTGAGVLSAASGDYAIDGLLPGRSRVRVTMLGYDAAEQEILVPPASPGRLDFALLPTAIALDELVVTATGQARKRELGNSVSTIDAAQIASAGASDPQTLLRARSTGVTVLQNSGQPGAGGTIRLRGNSSVSQGNNPIVYVDGIRIYNGAAPTSIASHQAAMPLNDISPADIARIEVVKGPAATTLYGTEASAGVIQIFTRSGTSGPARWNAEVSAGFNSMGHVGPASDPTGLFLNQCRGPNMVLGNGERFEDPGCPASGSWLKRGPIQRYALSVRGGSGDVTYYLSGNYGDARGVLGDGGSADGGFRASFTFLASPTLRVGVSTWYARRNTRWISDGNNINGFLLNASRGSGSNFKGTGCSSPSVTCLANEAIFTIDATTRADHYISGFTLNYDPSSKLTNRLNVGYDYNDLDNSTLVPFGFPRDPLGALLWDGWKRVLISADYAGSYRASLLGLASTSSVGGQLFDSRAARTSIVATNFSGPGAPTLTSAALRDVTTAASQRVVNAGLFLQEQVAWRDRLFLTAGLRVDGNSAFGEGLGLEPYPKLSASYVLSDHDFWPKLIETFRLRGAMGESGKAPGAFDAVRTWYPVAGDNGQPGFTPGKIGNPALGPERARETELGFEGSALKGRLGVDFTYYRRHTFDALIPVGYPPSQGFVFTQLENVGQLYGQGVELRLDLGLLRGQWADWSAHLNLSTVHSAAGDIGAQQLVVADFSRTYVRQGYPVPSYFGKHVKNPDELADPVFDTTYLGSVYPTKTIAPSTELTLLRRLTFQALGEWQLGGHLLDGPAYQNAYAQEWQPCYGVQAKLKSLPSNPGALSDVTALQRARCTLTSTVRDLALWVEPADFFKLRSLSLRYDVPARYLPGARNASLTLAGQNLFKSSKYSGTDPEIADQAESSFARRDYYVLPPPRTFLATLRIDF